MSRRSTATHDVYRNLHTKTWSVVHRPAGRVQSHPQEVAITQATLVVQPAGNATVRKTRQKLVHAYVRGYAPDPWGAVSADSYMRMVGGEWQRITYNPYENDTFVLADTNAPVVKADWVVLKADGSAWALNPN